MSTHNSWTGLGRLGRDADVRSTKSGRDVMNFSMATSHIWRDADGNTHEETEWHTIVFWARGEERSHAKLSPYMTKGRQVMVTGRIRTREWEDRNGEHRYRKEIIAKDVILTRSPSHATRTEAEAVGAEAHDRDRDASSEAPDPEPPDPDRDMDPNE